MPIYSVTFIQKLEEVEGLLGGSYNQSHFWKITCDSGMCAILERNSWHGEKSGGNCSSVKGQSRMLGLVRVTYIMGLTYSDGDKLLELVDQQQES